MKTSIEQLAVADLRSALPGLSKIVGRRTTLPVLSYVKVIHNRDHGVHLQVNNLDEVATVRLANPTSGIPGELLVPFTELATIVKRCSAADTIQLQDTGKETKIIYLAAGARIEKPVDHCAVEEFPPVPEVTVDPVALDNAFKQAIKEAFECASTDTSRYILNGACLDVTKKEAHYVVGTNGRHLYSANSFLFDIPTSLVIPNRKFIQWQGFQDDGPWILRFQPEIEGKGKAKVGHKPAWIRLDSDHWTYIAKPIDGNFPNWQQVVPQDHGPSRIILGESGVQTVLEALPLLPGADTINAPVSLEIARDELVLKARVSDKEKWNCVPVPARVSGPSVCISLNRTYLGRALRFGLTEIAIQDELSPLVFTTKGKIMVVMPLRPDTTPAAPVTQPPSVQPPAAQAAANPPTSPPEHDPAETPSPAESINTTETHERPQTMPANTNTMTAPRRGNLTNHDPEAAENSAIDEVMEKIDSIKTALRTVLEDLTETDRLLRRAIKEQKVSDKEINRARSALRSLQAVEL